MLHRISEYRNGMIEGRNAGSRVPRRGSGVGVFWLWNFCQECHRPIRAIHYRNHKALVSPFNLLALFDRLIGCVGVYVCACVGVCACVCFLSHWRCLLQCPLTQQQLQVGWAFGITGKQLASHTRVMSLARSQGEVEMQGKIQVVSTFLWGWTTSTYQVSGCLSVSITMTSQLQGFLPLLKRDLMYITLNMYARHDYSMLTNLIHKTIL